MILKESSEMKYLIIIICLAGLWINPVLSGGQTFSTEKFKDPPIIYWPRPLYFWNNTTVKEDVVVQQMQAFRDKCGYGGFGIVPFGKDFRPEYLSDDYLHLYGVVLKKAKELGFTLSLYDEFGFPSGSVGAFAEGDDKPRFQLKYPKETIERLDKTEEELSGPIVYEIKMSAEKLMGVVAMETTSLRRVDLTDKISGGNLKWNVPEGKWKIMILVVL